MLLSLPAVRRLAASILVASISFSAVASAAPGGVPYAATGISIQPAMAINQSGEINAPITLEGTAPAPGLLAHHEASIGATQLLTTGATSVASTVSKSMWGNMILSMALQQDDQVQQINKKLGKMSGLVFASVGIISALSVAQGIDGLATLQQDPHPIHPPILGLVGSGLTLISVASQAAMIHRYKKQLIIRQEEVADQVAHLLAHMNNEGVNDHVHSELSSLIGPLGAEEFLSLWKVAHPN